VICVRLILESHDGVICESDYHHLALRMLPAPDVHPEIETVVQVNIREERRNHSPYTKGNFEFERVVRGWRTRSPLLDLRRKK
jgi:hypothetical protein